MNHLSRLHRVFVASVGILACVAAVSFEHAAHASPNYPAIIDKHFGVSCPRPLTRCLICHTTAAGGIGTAKQVFAQALLNDYGLSGAMDGRSLDQALDRVPPELDSDGDGTPDLEELAKCGNPSGPELSEGPGYGCALMPSSRERRRFEWAFVVLAFSSLLRVRLSRRHRHA